MRIDAHPSSKSGHLYVCKASLLANLEAGCEKPWGAVQYVKLNNICLNRQVTSESAVRFTASAPQDTIVSVDVVRSPEVESPCNIMEMASPFSPLRTPSRMGAVGVTGKAYGGIQS